jgi:BTB/POZ domain-containing protein KCTD8/12/16
MEGDPCDLVELNVGGVTYATTLRTLQRAEPDSLLATIKSMTNDDNKRASFPRDSQNRLFIDRDGVLFRYILDYLRNQKLFLPEHFAERDRLRIEVDYYRLTSMSQALGQIRSTSDGNGKHANETISHLTVSTGIARAPAPRSNNGYIVVGYRGTFGQSTGRHSSTMPFLVSLSSIRSRWSRRC